MKKSRRGAGCIYRRGGVWWVKYYESGRAYLESSRSHKRSDAENLLKRRQGEIVQGRFIGLDPQRVCMGELLTDVENDYRLHKRKSLDDVLSRVRLHLMPVFGRVRVRSLNTESFTRYIIARRNSDAADATINRELAILRRALTLGATAEPPKVLHIPRIPRLDEDNVRNGFLEHHQYRALRDELPNYVQLLFVIGYHTGIRRGELLSIKWDQVDLEGKEIRLPGRVTKNRKPRTVPIYGEMKRWLQIAKERCHLNGPPVCEWVFSRHGRRLGDFRKVWEAACQKAGLSGLLFHDLRRSAIRNMERAGIPRHVAMEISGHRTENVYRRYDIVSGKDLQRAGVTLETYLRTEAELAETTTTELAERVQ